MKREDAIALLDMPRENAIIAILASAEKAEAWERLKAKGAATDTAPTTPSGMRPVYSKPAARGRRSRPGQKRGHPGVRRPLAFPTGGSVSHVLSACPCCEAKLGKSIRNHTRIIEDVPQVEPKVTKHTIYEYWCGPCGKMVSAAVTEAMPHASIGLHFLVLTAWLHYSIGVSVGNCAKIAGALLGFKVSPGGLTQGWQRLAELLEYAYNLILEAIRHSAALHADETGWRVNGITHWLWVFATRQYAYYLIDRHRSTEVVTSVLGKVFPGILITDFFGAYNALEAFAKQKCYFHMFTELVKVDKLTAAAPWKRFRKKLTRLLRDAVRLGERREKLSAKDYQRLKALVHRRLDALIAARWTDKHAKRLVKRLRRHRDEMLTFLDHVDVSPYNNHAEQNVGVGVHTRKVSQQNRSAAGAKAHAILLSLFRTAHLQKKNPVTYVLDLAVQAIKAQKSGAAKALLLPKAA
jgi:transposase